MYCSFLCKCNAVLCERADGGGKWRMDDGPESLRCGFGDGLAGFDRVADFDHGQAGSPSALLERQVDKLAQLQKRGILLR